MPASGREAGASETMNLLAEVQIFHRDRQVFMGRPNSIIKTPPESDLPEGLAAPARRALAGAGIARLEQLAGLSEARVKGLHGIGPNALDRLRRLLAAKGLSFAGGKRGKAHV